jgi:hypothetical protein
MVKDKIVAKIGHSWRIVSILIISPGPQGFSAWPFYS